MPKGIKGFVLGHKHTIEVKRKIGEANKKQVVFNCDMCGKESTDRPSHYARKKRHFCSISCYALFRKELLPTEEHNRFGTGLSQEERAKRVKARSILNHYLRDKKIKRPGCEECGAKSEAHHTDYNNPLDVKWLCFFHHRKEHNQHPELLNN